MTPPSFNRSRVDDIVVAQVVDAAVRGELGTERWTTRRWPRKLREDDAAAVVAALVRTHGWGSDRAGRVIGVSRSRVDTILAAVDALTRERRARSARAMQAATTPTGHGTPTRASERSSSMSAQPTWTVACNGDRCDTAQTGAPGQTAAQLRDDLDQRGWRTGVTGDLCPNCIAAQAPAAAA